ncbi:MAG: virulence RhuM family protein [Lachnospiraceae bacterium]|nr:virulence RhuM family protein [Lachnospiraceae bacterium]
MEEHDLQVTAHDFLIYKDENGEIKVRVLLINKNLWLTQNLIAELFDVEQPAIAKHIKNIYKEEELQKSATHSKTELVQQEGNRFVKRNIDIYNLDMIIAVGYRVNSKKATKFRQWSNKVLKEYIIKGFVMDDERLKIPNYAFGEDYFEEQLERIRNIRSSERRFYQKITDIYAECSLDYDSNSETTRIFFKTVQNKMHYAVSGQTAAEIIHSRVDSEKPHMGLTTWKKAPQGRIYKFDVDIAKNYLNEQELDDLNRIVELYLNYAEMQAKRHNAMTMKNWIEKLNSFLKFNERDILSNAGKISHEVAQALAYKEYDKYQAKQDKLHNSDFDKYIEELRSK